jgi:hypothetical protein
MGAFIPSVSDNEICDALTKRFSDDRIASTQPLTYIQQLKNHAENLFDNNHHLHRVAHRLSVSVSGGSSVPAVKKHRLRWFHLLHKLLPPETDAAIRKVLMAVLDPANNIDKAIFSTRPAPIGLAFELYPQNSGQPYIPAGTNDCLLILECKVDQPLPDPQPGTENDPPDPDHGEHRIAAPGKRKAKSAKKPPAKKSSAKKSAAKKSKAKKSKAKKSSAKKAKKSYGKKTAAKKAKKGVKKTKKGKSRR